MAWPDLKGGAKNNKSPKVPTYLRQIGFEIVGSPPSQSSVVGRFATWGKTLDPILRHPLTLVLLSSVLTLGVGSWLTATYQERQREREATVKSMDELRAAIDDVAFSFVQYNSASTDLISLKESGAPTDQVTAAQTAFNNAGEMWRQKFFVEVPNIRQRMRGNRGGDATMAILTEIEVGSIMLDTCLGAGRVESVPGGVAKTRITCAYHVKGYRDLSADERAARLGQCFQWFQLFVRPDPKNDFDSEAQVQTKLGGALMKVHNICIAAI